MRWIFIALAAILTLGEACGRRRERQELQTAHGKILFSFDGEALSGIEVFSSELPDGYLKIQIKLTGGRTGEWDFYARRGRSLAEIIFRSKETSVTSSGISFHDESGPEKDGMVVIRECRLTSTGTLLLKEVQKYDENWRFKSREFIGPFGVDLKPNK
jgi:hypothetical protein